MEDIYRLMADNGDEVFMTLAALIVSDLHKYINKGPWIRDRMIKREITGCGIIAALHYETDTYPKITFYCDLPGHKRYVVEGFYLHCADPEKYTRMSFGVDEKPIGRIGPLYFFYRPEAREFPEIILNWTFYENMVGDSFHKKDVLAWETLGGHLERWWAELKSEAVLARLAFR